MEKLNVKKLSAEFLGTLVLVLFACGAAVFIGATQLAGDYLAIAFAFGLVIVAMAYVIGPISGCHINPAVSLAMFINKRIDLKEFITYVIAQILGAIAGAAILLFIVKGADMDPDQVGLGQNFFGKFDVLHVIVIEVILTFVFVLTILGVTGKNGNPKIAGLVIGLTLALVHIFGIALTGTSVNPARSIGPALFIGGDAIKELWPFVVAPLVGGALAALTGKHLFDTEEN